MGTMATPYKDPKSGIYYVRVVVPADVRHIIGKREFKKSLRTKDSREAKLRAIEPTQDAYSQIQLARAKLSDASYVELTPRDCAVIAQRWYARVRSRIEAGGDTSEFISYDVGKLSDTGLTDESLKVTFMFGLTDTLSIQGSEIERATDEELTVLIDELAHIIDPQLDIEGLIVSHQSNSYLRLIRNFFPYLYAVEKLCKARIENDWAFEPVKQMTLVDKPLQARKSTSSRGKPEVPVKHSMSQVYESHRESKLLSNKGDGSVLKTLDETAKSVRRFVEIVGDKDVTAIVSADLVHFRNTLLKLPKSKQKAIRSLPIDKQVKLAETKGLDTLSPSTVKKDMRLVTLVFNHAVELGIIQDNPMARVQVPSGPKRTEAAEDRGYSLDEINRLFALPIFTDPTATKRYGLASYWIPLLCRYTGARVGELTQLRKEDICKDSKGIYFLNIRRGEDQSVKNDTPLRHVPLHEHLLELGFIDYVKAADGWLFPQIPADKYGKKVPYIGDWWGKVVKAEGIKISQPLHAFRHSFKTLLRTLEVSDSVSNSITGHSSGNVGDEYGTVYLDTKQKAINRIPRLTLKKLWEHAPN